MHEISFGSDNHSGVHPEILAAICKANSGHAPAYGSDSYTLSAIEELRRHFGEKSDPYFVLNGTGANVLSLKSMMNSYQAILCSDSAHIHTSEIGATENFIGCKLYLINGTDGKLDSTCIQNYLESNKSIGSRTKVISICQPTEFGTVYSLEEIRKIAEFVHSRGMLLHMDGARLSNAAARLKCSLADTTKNVGVDVLSFGGTKNGLLLGEAIIFFDKFLSKDFSLIRHQGLQLISKMRFIAAQFEAYLKNDLWLKNAAHSNEMATQLSEEIHKLPGFRVSRPVQSNAVFAIFPKDIIPQVKSRYQFHVWNEATSEVRLMASFDTQTNDIHEFVQYLRLCFT